jgi:hypothetical protein
MEAAYWNSRYPLFYLTRYSDAQKKYIRVGRPRPDIRAALKAATKADARNPKWWTFIDVDPRPLPDKGERK